MSEELLGVIITSGVTSIISVIGFIVTYMKRNFKEELEKEKQSPPSGTTYKNMVELDEGGDDKYLRKALRERYGRIIKNIQRYCKSKQKLQRI